MSTRHWDWPERLAAFVEERRAAPFEWGANDCCLFAADAVQAMTGRDLAARWRGYSTDIEAARIMKEFGGVEGLATAALGEPIDWKMAQRGDVVSCETGGRLSLAVCVGDQWVGAGAMGTVFGDMSTVERAWRV